MFWYLVKGDFCSILIFCIFLVYSSVCLLLCKLYQFQNLPNKVLIGLTLNVICNFGRIGSLWYGKSSYWREKEGLKTEMWHQTARTVQLWRVFFLESLLSVLSLHFLIFKMRIISVLYFIRLFWELNNSYKVIRTF